MNGLRLTLLCFAAYYGFWPLLTFGKTESGGGNESLKAEYMLWFWVSQLLYLSSILLMCLKPLLFFFPFLSLLLKKHLPQLSCLIDMFISLFFSFLLTDET